MVRVDLILRKKLKFIKDIFGSIKDIKIKKENFFLKKFNFVNEMLTKYEMRQNFLSSLQDFGLSGLQFCNGSACFLLC